MYQTLRSHAKRFVLRQAHLRNERQRVALYGNSIPDPLAWGAQFDGEGRLTMCGQPLVDLANRFGTPLHVINRPVLARDYHDFIGAFAAHAPTVRLGYSYKTNPLPGVLAELHAMGAMAEVISHFELWLALKLGVPPHEILFNGPGKSAAAIELAVERGVSLINVDSLAEIDVVAAAAKRTGRVMPIGVRVITSVGWSAQFGLSLQSGDAREAFRRIVKEPNLRASGLHVHLGTGIRDTAIYLKAIRELLDFARSLRQELDVRITHLDLGGGFGVPTVRPLGLWDHRLIANGMPPGPVDRNAAPRPRDYAAAIANELRAAYPDEHDRPQLIFEPGRAVTSSAQCLLLTVLAVKESVNQRPKVIVDGGKNIAMPTGYEVHELLPLTAGYAPRDVEIDVFGPLCHPGDNLYTAQRFRRLAPGDRVAIMDAGAYFIPNQMNFSHPRTAAVLIDEGVPPRVLRQRESFDHMVLLDSIVSP